MLAFRSPSWCKVMRTKEKALPVQVVRGTAAECVADKRLLLKGQR
jgi:hypothetical protein